MRQTASYQHETTGCLTTELGAGTGEGSGACGSARSGGISKNTSNPPAQMLFQAHLCSVVVAIQHGLRHPHQSPPLRGATTEGESVSSLLNGGWDLPSRVHQFKGHQFEENLVQEGITGSPKEKAVDTLEIVVSDLSIA